MLCSTWDLSSLTGNLQPLHWQIKVLTAALVREVPRPMSYYIAFIVSVILLITYKGMVLLMHTLNKLWPRKSKLLRNNL